MGNLEQMNAELNMPSMEGGAIEHLSLALVIIDSNGAIRIFNRRAELLFGYTKEEIIGQVLETLLPDYLKEIHLQHRLHYIEDPHDRPMNSSNVLEGKTKQGKTIKLKAELATYVVFDGTFHMALLKKIPDGDTGAA